MAKMFLGHDTSYRERVLGRIGRARRRGAQAMTLAALVSGAFAVFLVYILVTAYQLGSEPGVRAAWLGLSIVLVANGLAYWLYRSQSRVLERATAELAELLDVDGGAPGAPEPGRTEPKLRQGSA